MLPTRETTALDVWTHALDHGDRPVIHGAEIDYDDVHDGVHYHADLLKAALDQNVILRERRDRAATALAITIDVYEKSGHSPRRTEAYRKQLAEYRRLDAELQEGYARSDALRAKRDQDAAMATYEVSA